MGEVAPTSADSAHDPIYDAERCDFCARILEDVLGRLLEVDVDRDAALELVRRMREAAEWTG